MIHNIVTDKNGDEHQAVERASVGCFRCSLDKLRCYDIDGSECTFNERRDRVNVIYKRRIKIGDIKK